MTNVKGRVTDTLKNATTWLSTNDVVGSLGISHSSAGRALRRIWLVGTVSKKRLPGDRYGRMQWIHVDNVNKNFPDAQPPTSTVYTKKSSTKRAKKLASITPINTTSNQGDLIMQIEQGVETIVNEWVAADKKFSAHDITKELRDRVNSGSLQVDPGLAGTAHVGGKDVTKIEHSFVRDAVHKLMTSGVHPNYDRAHNGQFFEYFPQAAAPPAPTSSTPSTPPATDGGSYDGSSTL